MSFFTVLSIFGVFVGLFVTTQGLWFDGMGAFLCVLIGLFVTVKEIMDIFFAN